VQALYKKDTASDATKPFNSERCIEQMRKGAFINKRDKPKVVQKVIWIEDSYKSGACVKHKKSVILNPRNPLRIDDTIINYDLDSEEEWHEENGEDLNS